ncbi:DUF1624 domain-containing protein [Zoogloea sp.]|uniref:DUF1624 domain-containing protein n=1 Tax=Zoogloea sp. TaxID=49181 RepID=UPI0035ADF4C3
MHSVTRSHRIGAIDTLRGLVMVLMLVDHVREFFYLHRQVADPMVVGETSPELFFTRLTSHFCAPVFVFLTGLGAWFHGSRDGATRQGTAVYLAKRGLLLMALELSLINFAWTFSFPPTVIYLQVIWAIGLSMLALAALLWLPVWAQVALGLLIIGGHNLLDSVHFAAGSAAHVPWAILHDRGMIALGEGLRARTSYPVLPWIGVILLGHGAGSLYRAEVLPEQRQRYLCLIGAAALSGFFLLRLLNVYGDHAWAMGGTGLATVMSFLNVTKYPPSLLFLLLTLGVGMLALGLLERARVGAVLACFGRVPLFFYVLHLYGLHLLYLAFVAVLGRTQGDRYGFVEVWPIWVVAGAALVLLYLPCRWFAGVKQRSGAGWTSYF